MIFTPETIHKGVADHLEASGVNPDATGAIVLAAVREEDGKIVVKAAVSAKINDRWEVKGLFVAENKKDFGFGVETKIVW